MTDRQTDGWMDRQTEGAKQQGGDMIGVFWVTGLKILGRIGIQFFFWIKKIPEKTRIVFLRKNRCLPPLMSKT